MRESVKFEIFYPYAPKRVWRALTSSEDLSQWLMPANFKPLMGFRFRFDKPQGGKIEGKVVEAVEAETLAYTWDDEDGQPSLVIWRLAPDGSGTRVSLEHVLVGQPEVTCIAQVEPYFNWSYALRHSLPGLLRILEATQGRMPRPPIVYVVEEELSCK